MKMKKILLIAAASLFMFACGNENATTCKEDCKKECCKNEGDKKCKKDCKKACCTKGDEKKGCEKDCKKECCANKVATNMEIGTMNPSLDTKLKDISGEEFHLENLGKKNGTLLIFSCNTCPFVVGRANGETEGWQNRYNDIQALADANEIGFALINSNEAKRNGDDSFDEMVKHAADNEYANIKYLVDTKSEVANEFNAKTTPHVYLFNSDHKLVYTGAIDDNVDKKSEVKEHWLNDAMNNLAKGTTIEPAVTKNLGCSIKRVKKEEEK